MKTIMTSFCPPIRRANVKKPDSTKHLELSVKLRNNENLCRLLEEAYLDKNHTGKHFVVSRRAEAIHTLPPHSFAQG